MNETLKDLMRDATRLTRGGRLTEATALLQQMLRQKAGARVAPPAADADVLDGCVFEVELPAGGSATTAPPSAEGHACARAAGAASPGEFGHGVHTHASLTRAYKLYVPPSAGAGKPLPLVVMLHGCTQNPDDFAAGTGMNERARREGFFVLYPAQSQEANASRCWNWFKHNHQQRDRGEPALLASLTRSVMHAHPIDPARVYVAGLSAGGAMAAIMGAAYPELYAAVGVHSGLAPGVASNVGEALSAMNGAMNGLAGAAAPARSRAAAANPPSPRRSPALAVPTIVFHGDQDKTVNPVNGNQVIDARLSAQGAGSGSSRLEQGTSERGRRFTRKVYRDGEGGMLGEHWLVHGAGHAWSGGSAAGSYTDELGPDATGEMLRFFFAHPKP